MDVYSAFLRKWRVERMRDTPISHSMEPPSLIYTRYTISMKKIKNCVTSH